MKKAASWRLFYGLVAYILVSDTGSATGVPKICR
jgi:hypothetical protein